MLLEHRPVKQIIAGYQFHFDLDPHADTTFRDYCNTCPFRSFSVGCYHAVTDTSRVCQRDKDLRVIDPASQPKPVYLPLYEKNVHRRIRPLYRSLRDSLVIELRGTPLSEFSLGNEGTLPSNGRPLVLRGLVVLQKIGIGSISIWIENLAPATEAQWRELRDPRLVAVTLATVDIARTNWPLIEFVRYLVLLSHIGLTGNPVKSRELESASYLSSDRELEEHLITTIPGFEGSRPFISVEIDNYPFFFIQYDVTSADMRQAFIGRPEDIRLALCGDSHWKWKSQAVVDSSVMQADTSSRESILWLVNSEGTVKIVSNELETSVEESLTAMLVENDIILTMRYFLQTTSRLISRLSDRSLRPSELTDLRQLLFTNIDKYCNIEVSHKDTTRRRMEQFKQIFHIDSVYSSLVDRFDLLSSRLAAKNSLGIERQQILLTLVFGFFGALNVLYRLFTEVAATTKRGWYMQRASAVAGSFAIALLLWMVARAVRRRAR